AVDRVELDGRSQVAERDDGLFDVEDDRVSNVRDRDAVADSRGSELLAREEDAQEELAVDLLGELQEGDDRPERLLLRRPLNAAVDAAARERVRDARQLGALLLRPVEEARGDGEALLGRPLEELGAIESVLLVELIGREAPLLDPLVDLLLGDA